MRIREVIEKISDSLKSLSSRQMDWIKQKHLNYVNDELKKRENKRKFVDNAVFSLFQYVGEWQIERVFLSTVSVSSRHTKIEHTSVREFTQWFYNVRTHKEYYMQRPLGMFGVIVFSRPLSFRTALNAGYVSSCSGDVVVYSSFQPSIVKRGLIKEKREYSVSEYDGYGWNVRRVFHYVFKDSFYETLLKSDYWKFACRPFTDIQKKAMFIAIRHHLEIDDIQEWCDAVNLMEQTNIDWHNPILLKDYKHQHILALRKIDKENRQKELDKVKSQEMEYQKTHGKYLDIEFVENDLNYHVLKSVKEFYEEGEHMHHCVYKCGYYKKDDVLIFSVRNVQNERVATIEYNISENKVLQCRGVCNARPLNYDTIVSTFSENVSQYVRNRIIKKCA